MPNPRRRPQKPKPNKHEHVLDLRRGSRTDPIPSGATYIRPRAGARNKDW